MPGVTPILTPVRSVPGRVRTHPSPSAPARACPLYVYRLAGNRAFGRLQAKLAISQPGDAYEVEADRVAEQVMRMPVQAAEAVVRIPSAASGPGLQRCACGGPSGGSRPCKACAEEEEGGLHRSVAESGAVEVAPPIVHDVLRSPGEPLDSGIRSYMEPRFGRDFGDVRIYRNSEAARSARAVNALAYTVGSNIVFGSRQFVPATGYGRRILAHELAHVVQQSGPSAVVRLARLSPALCAFGSRCAPPDTAGAGTASSWKLTLAVDREETGLGRLFSGNVGHTWVKLSDNGGTKYSYGFWPQVGFDSSHPLKSVKGCVHHPDIAHEPPLATDYIDIDYSIKSSDHANGLAHAQKVCRAAPDYNLKDYNCTTFAIDVAKAAGVTPPSSTTLAIHNPNALYEGIEKETKKRGTSGSGATSSKK